MQGLIASSLSTCVVGQSGGSGYVRLETDDIADHHEVAMYTTTTPGPSSSVMSNVPEHPNQPRHSCFLNGNLERKRL